MSASSPPHPAAHVEPVPRWAYACADCGRRYYVAENQTCTPDGAGLLCWDCSLARSGGDYQGRYWWCRYGQHVMEPGDPKCGAGAHVKAERVQRAQKQCEQCGAGFTPARRDARFCSGRCRVAAHRNA